MSISLGPKLTGLKHAIATRRYGVSYALKPKKVQSFYHNFPVENYVIAGFAFGIMLTMRSASKTLCERASLTSKFRNHQINGNSPTTKSIMAAMALMLQ